ncbi:MAG: hypothetical protein FWF42_00745 [Streptococcaceae bacterium]|nr:hypothetical protein [Streptococcaceae bacterium]MCL2681457.1 hypothetical protein [Streptococcaceae bacterium]MCL2858196.1 hypothetical protein [Streptococcaceae bacterium]
MNQKINISLVLRGIAIALAVLSLFLGTVSSPFIYFALTFCLLILASFLFLLRRNSGNKFIDVSLQLFALAIVIFVPQRLQINSHSSLIFLIVSILISLSIILRLTIDSKKA